MRCDNIGCELTTTMRQSERFVYSQIEMKSLHLHDNFIIFLIHVSDFDSLIFFSTLLSWMVSMERMYMCAAFLYSVYWLPIAIPAQVKRVIFRCSLYIFFLSFQYGTKANGKKHRFQIEECIVFKVFTHTLDQHQSNRNTSMRSLNIIQT